MSSFILLSAKGDIKSGTLGDVAKLGGIEAALSKALKRAKAPTLIGSWTWQKFKLFLYGFKEGRAGTENKHELPPPHDELLLFGDACIVASLEKSAEKPTTISVDMYKKFYNSKFGGFEDLGDEDSDDDDEEEEEEEEEEDYVEGDDEEEEEDEEVLGEEEEEEEEQAKPTLLVKTSGSTFKKIAKWMHAQPLQKEEYPL